MSELITASLINFFSISSTTIIGVFSFFIIRKSKRSLIKLSKSVEMYSLLEIGLIKEKLLIDGNIDPTEGQINQLKGIKRKEILGLNSTLLLNARQAKIIRERFLDISIDS